ncbi:MAG: hypothetical protein ACYDEC_14570, partial [Bacteroidia bacterium]
LIEPANRNKYGFNSIKSANTTIIPSISIHCESSKIILGTCMVKMVETLLLIAFYYICPLKAIQSVKLHHQIDLSTNE